jgi:hypothetical protein
VGRNFTAIVSRLFGVRGFSTASDSLCFSAARGAEPGTMLAVTTTPSLRALQVETTTRGPDETPEKQV